MTKIKKRSKSRSRILSVCLLICIIAVSFSLGGCFKILEMIAESLPEPTELKVGFDANNVKVSRDYQYIPAIYSDTKIFDRDNVKLDLYIGGDSKDWPSRKFVGVYLLKPGFNRPNGIEDYRNIEGWTLLKEYPIEEYENGERSERVRIGGYYLDMYLTEITIPESFFTEEKENFYLVACPIMWDKDLGKWNVVILKDFNLDLTYELLPDNKVKINEYNYFN